MIRIATSIIGALLLAAGLCIVIVFGSVLDMLAGHENAALGAFDLSGGIMAIAGLLMVAIILASKSSSTFILILNQALYSLLFVGCLLIFYLLAENRTSKWDATSRKYYTLSPQTIDYLSNLKTPIEIMAFYAPGEGPGKQNILNALNRYRQMNDIISVHACNLITQPFQAMQFANDVKPGEIFIRRNDSASTGGAFMQRIKGFDEETMTNAIVKAVQGFETWVYFLTGHSEMTPSDSAGKKPDERISQMASFLKDRGFKIETLNLLAGRGAMPDAKKSIIFCIQPQTDLQPPERQTLETWLNNGGKALFMLDPITDRRSSEFVEFRKLLQDYGIDVRHSIVYDILAQTNFKDYVGLPVIVAKYGAHSISENMPRIVALMSKARPIHKARYLSPSMTVVEFLFSAPKQVYEIDLQQAVALGGISSSLYRDLPSREIPLAVASEVRMKGQLDQDSTKVVVYGDSDLFSDRMWDIVPSTLFANTVNWLSASENQIPIPANRPSMPPLAVPHGKIQVLRVILILVIPFIVFFGGIGYTLLRKRLG